MLNKTTCTTTIQEDRPSYHTAACHVTKLVTEPRTPPSGFNCSPCGTRLTVVPLHDTRLQQSGTLSTCVLHCIYATHGMARHLASYTDSPSCLVVYAALQHINVLLAAFVSSAFWFLVTQHKTLAHSSLHLGAQTTAGSWSSNVDKLDDSLTDVNLDTLNS